MKTKKELNAIEAIEEEVKTASEKLRELSDEELDHVSGGVVTSTNTVGWANLETLGVEYDISDKPVRGVPVIELSGSEFPGIETAETVSTVERDIKTDSANRFDLVTADFFKLKNGI